ncbi:MAG: tRNA 4-thiouridine(8) synthase ThiI [candidate division WOR-3 bacterium]|nr:tRNA 4-thiouridine(8) synthase ThiI [candidate division WOR-3 bacterium]MCX7756775.1 tRNA 4-thiouridine(8) synthase ThiI [candidate division WOR-3 bacterium]MDW7987732.1 tRNA 4-thiouridine(8) synthase ThiI [candidate division WOR-3 bacterium]
MAKAVGLISGGLDSILATKMILDQGISVIGLNFISPFFDNSSFVENLSKVFSIDIHIERLGADYINIIKNPKYGYGKNLNPCIDCHIFMLKQAKSLMEKINADFVFTGEVLNERPMSQNFTALSIIEKESSLEGVLLRPLSAQLLPPTVVELRNIVKRELLGNIQGRSRKPQLELAHKFGITKFPQPAGGCLLTDPDFSRRLKDAFLHNEDTLFDITLLKIGRHFRLDDPQTSKIIVGRNEKENELLHKLVRDVDLLLEPVDTPGPVVMVPNRNPTPQIINFACGLCARYSDKSDNKELVKVKFNDIIIEAMPLNDEVINKYRI